MDEEGNVKLCDFGWSVETNSTGVRDTYCGTYDYMPPEMIQYKKYDSSLDIWCLGILLYEMTHGKSPFHGKSDEETIRNIHNNKRTKCRETLSQAGRDLIKSVGLIPYSFSPE